MSEADEEAIARRERKVWIIAVGILALVLFLISASRFVGADTQQSPTTATMPAAAIKAWEVYARENCALQDERFILPRFQPFTDTENTPDGFIPADFNGDGTRDFVVITPHEGCGTDGDRIDPGGYGNHGGPPTNFVVSTSAGYQAFEGFAGWISPEGMIERRGKQDVLHFRGVSNGRCGPIVSAIWGWTGSSIDILERRNDKDQTVDAEGCLADGTIPPDMTPIASAEPPLPQYDHDPVDRYIEFRTNDAERIVRGFRISCPQEGKSIALMDVLREATRQGSYYMGAHLYTTVDSRSGKVRIYHQMRIDNGQSNPPHVVMSLSEWGDLQLYDIREEAVMSLCYF
ncbi:MAG TPA: hypothetical protein VL094_12420 [Sphingomonadaceae bacterium]|nr:hypothetical protein [Sphingomonadaceae bacterium]